jgi:tetratricopeptide (TPR) repeat protein
MKRHVAGRMAFYFGAVLLFIASRPLGLTIEGPSGPSLPQQPSQTTAPPNIQAEVQQGLAALRQGNFASAEHHFAAALKLDPNLPEVRADLGLAYYADHQYARAIPEFQAALRQNASLQTAKSFLPLSLAATGHCEQAIPGLDHEFSNNPNLKLRRVLGLSLEKCLIESGKQAQADAAAQKLLAEYPNDPDVLYTAGELYGKLSSQIYLKLMKVAPHSARTYQVMASVAATDGNWKRAIEADRQALRIDPGLEGAHLQIAILLLTHSPDPKAWRQALVELNDELKINPLSAEAVYEMGEVYRKHGELNQAVETFQRALQLDPAAVPTRIGLAKALFSLGKKQEALAALEPARQAAPDDPDVHFLLASIDRSLGHTAEAQSEMQAFERLQRSPQPNGSRTQ